MGIAGGDDSDSSEDEKRRKKRNAKPCGRGGKGGGRTTDSTPEPGGTEEIRRRRRRAASLTQRISANESDASMRKRRDVIDPDNVMANGENPEVGNIFKRVMEAAQNVIQKIRTMFSETSGNPNGSVDYLDGVQDAEMI